MFDDDDYINIDSDAEDSSHADWEEESDETGDDSFDYRNINSESLIFHDDYSIDIASSESMSDSEMTGNMENEQKHDFYSSKYFRMSKIAFGSNGRCRICNCGGWAGFGDTCENCGHFYSNHI